MINSGNATMLDTTTENLFSDIGLNSSIGLDNYTSNAIGGNGDITTPGPIRDGDGNIICEGPSEEEYMFYVTFAWWLEGFGQILVGSLGRLRLFIYSNIKSSINICHFIFYYIDFDDQSSLNNFDLGFISNVIAVPILLSKEMSNVFNRMLSALSVVDSVFIVCSILEAIRKHIGILLEYIS